MKRLKLVGLLLVLVVTAFGVATISDAGANGGSDCVVGAETQTCPAKAITAHECNDEELHFVITQVDAEDDAPASITVTYVGGATEVIPLTNYTGNTAHYTTTTAGGVVESASVVIYLGWSGTFNLSHGLCGEGTTTTTAETTTSESTTTSSSTPPPPPPPPTTSSSTSTTSSTSTSSTTAPPTTTPPDTCCVVTTTAPPTRAQAPTQPSFTG